MMASDLGPLARTPLFEQHLAAGAKMVDFGGWEMPLHYGSQLREHQHVRQAAGMFDVSHMTVVDVQGPQAQVSLQILLANDVARLRTPGKALYSCMLREDGGVIDDLIVYWRGDDRYRLVVNASTRDKDLAWMRARLAGFEVELEERPELAMVAVQGPQARALAAAQLPADLADEARALQPFSAAEAGDWFVARTGYTGEDGFEIILPAAAAQALWQALSEAGVVPCGLGARDTLRLEAGMNLYGSDMNETTSPLESGLAWTVAWEPRERDFVGRKALEAQRVAGVTRRLVGLVLLDRGVLRDHQAVQVPDCGVGEITSGGFAPTLQRSIALARVPVCVGDTAMVEIRGRPLHARVVRPPFVRHGEALVDC